MKMLCLNSSCKSVGHARRALMEIFGTNECPKYPHWSRRIKIERSVCSRNLISDLRRHSLVEGMISFNFGLHRIFCIQFCFSSKNEQLG